MQLAELDLGPAAHARVEILPTGTSGPTYVTTFAEALEYSELTVTDFDAGTAVVFVAVGANPELGAGPWYRELTYTVLRPDP